MGKLVKHDSQNNVFLLSNAHISYVMEIVENDYLVHRYWGESIKSYNFSNKPKLKKRTFAATPHGEKPEFSPEFLPFEFPSMNQGDFRSPALQVETKNGETIVRFKYDTFEVVPTTIVPPDLPHVRSTDEYAETLCIVMKDELSNIELTLYYTIFDNSPIIIRSSKIENKGPDQLKIRKNLSASVDTLYDDQIVTTFYGTHQKEFQMNRSSIQHGVFKIGSSRGASGPQYPPYIALSKDADESHGNVHAMTLIYSGNHEITLERDQYNFLRLQIGLNSDTFSWHLNRDESFYSPQAVLNFSSDGFNGSSQNFHHFFKNHLISPNWKDRQRPIVINSWEMSYFGVNESIVKNLIDSAVELGFETVVLDDGWYSNRNSSKTSLGDWEINRDKFPNGIKPLVNYAKENGIGFGIWFEPEMISPDTRLIKNHPDWVMRSPNHEPLLGRNQYILDLTNSDVQQFIISTLENAILEYGITYVKWDMNRHITDPFSQTQHFYPAEYSHRYILGLYKILEAITSKFPEILFENCSSGGGRSDPGMLYYFPQTWISDNTDALDRQSIQFGASYLFPISSITGHVSDIPNHQTGRKSSFKTRACLASSTNMGYEMDIISLNDQEKKEIKKHLVEYKLERDLIMNGKFHRLVSPFNKNTCSWVFYNDTEAILYFFRNTYQVFDLSLIIKIPVLDSSSFYKEESTDRIYSGSELANCGLSLENPIGDLLVNKVKLKKIVLNDI
ncbi:alpha-galactosidase [Enterococcus casseliflavus]|uniref:alpha-galactosidase n=1 Tax=Enterococcus casseliflavus TaxID=37734 RepID=UPI0022E56B2F|nr:alpha-galactosidase [Enterococcus casseliflavus]